MGVAPEQGKFVWMSQPEQRPPTHAPPRQSCSLAQGRQVSWLRSQVGLLPVQPALLAGSQSSQRPVSSRQTSRLPGRMVHWASDTHGWQFPSTQMGAAAFSSQPAWLMASHWRQLLFTQNGLPGMAAQSPLSRQPVQAPARSSQTAFWPPQGGLAPQTHCWLEQPLVETGSQRFAGRHPPQVAGRFRSVSQPSAGSSLQLAKPGLQPASRH